MSAFVANAIIEHSRRETAAEMMARHGYAITKEGMDRAGTRLAAKRAEISEAIEAGEL